MNERTSLSLNPEALIAAYRERRFDELSKMLLGVLEHFRDHRYAAFEGRTAHFVNVFLKHFLHFFTQEDYVPSEADMVRFIELNLVIGDLVAASDFRTTDPYVEILRTQSGNFGKLLSLYSARNTAALDRAMLFRTEPNFATQWYFCFWENYKTCCAEQDSLAHLRAHLGFRDEHMGAINRWVHHAYFGCTYADGERDRDLKRHVNRVFQDWEVARRPVANRPDRRKLALITAMWFPHQSVYRCTYSFVKALAEEFELTLVHLGRERPDIDRSLFKEVRNFQMRLPMDLAAVTPNDWGIAYFPDVGMNIESIFLSNLRLAPVQVCGYGHPVSTFGSKIDYWLGGRDIESLEDAERNYDERLVLVPGSGVAPNRPDYTPRGSYAPGERLLVNCAWTSQKINYPLLERLQRILARTRREVRFRFFTGGSLAGNAYIPFARGIERLLGAAHAEVVDGLPYRAYMARMEEGDLGLDSYPFGGYATATDSLYLRIPMLTWEGRKFYNRSAASLLRRVGLEELIVHDGEAYEAQALRLIEDDAWRNALRAKLAAADLEQALFAHDDAKYVARALRMLVDRNDALRQDGHRRPIVIPA